MTESYLIAHFPTLQAEKVSVSIRVFYVVFFLSNNVKSTKKAPLPPLYPLHPPINLSIQLQSIE